MEWVETLPFTKSIKLLCFCKDKDPRHPAQIFPHGMVTISNYILLLGKFRLALGVDEQPPVTRGMAMNDVQLSVTCAACFSSLWFVPA